MNKICFVEMPFSPEFDGIWMSVIKPAIEELGDTAIRADDIFKPGSILDDMFESIKSADYIIADISMHNPNVYYELGYSHALNKKVILITKNVFRNYVWIFELIRCSIS